MALAAGCAGQGKKETERPNYSITLKVAEKLREVGEAAQKEKWEEATAKVNRILESDYINPYERAAALQARAGIQAAQGHFDQALPDMEQAVALDAMPEERQQDATYNLAQNYFVLERFEQSADTFAKWEKNAKEPSGDQLYVIASAYAQAKRFTEALPYAKRALDAIKPPTEPLLQFMASLYYELDQQQDLADVLERLTKAFPGNKAHWLQLSATYVAIGDEKKALAALDAAHEKKLLSEEKEILELSRLHSRTGHANRCATLLHRYMGDGTVSKGAASYEMLAGCQLTAKDVEGAAATMKAAESLLGNGELYLDLAKQQLARGKWTEARDAAALAFEKGGLSSPAQARLVLGIAHHYTKRKDAALSALAEARKDPEVSKCADAWLQTVKSGKGIPDCLDVGGK